MIKMEKKLKYILIGFLFLMIVDLIVVDFIILAVVFNIPPLTTTGEVIGNEKDISDINWSEMEEGDSFIITEGQFAGKTVVLLKKGYYINAGEIQSKEFEVES